MADTWKLLLALCLIALPLAIAGGDAAAMGWVMPAVRSGCRGTVAECLANEEDEFELDSESNRRIILASRRHISYEALKRNNVPCSRRGASYYNCRPGAQANPYTRGCSAITRCRS
ncbi:rapid alkalinization factor-like [Salvia divinorum]|uniref:Rapid alkalinization factor-like n=1 Tax=Salvia divinorum TaxID=28513 RepID=A0ABD1GQ23_SALDI